jgi:hypothetical protein
MLTTHCLVVLNLRICGVGVLLHVRWVPCHHGMAHSQVVDGSPPGTEGSCKYIE